MGKDLLLQPRATGGRRSAPAPIRARIVAVDVYEGAVANKALSAYGASVRGGREFFVYWGQGAVICVLSGADPTTTDGSRPLVRISEIEQNGRRISPKQFLDAAGFTDWTDTRRTLDGTSLNGGTDAAIRIEEHALARNQELEISEPAAFADQPDNCAGRVTGRIVTRNS